MVELEDMSTAPSSFDPLSVNNDPEEVDISNHPFKSTRASPSPRLDHNSRVGETSLRQMLREDRLFPNNQAFPGSRQQGQSAPTDMKGPQPEQDPMMQILQQILSGKPGSHQEGDEGLAPGLAGMFGPRGDGGDVQQRNPYVYIWKLIHAVFALALGAYIVSSMSFSGSRINRMSSLLSQDLQSHILWIFATGESMLQSARFFLERGKRTPSGIMETLAKFLPAPLNGQVRLIARYGSIYTTIVEDSMVVVFILGFVAWSEGAVA